MSTRAILLASPNATTETHSVSGRDGFRRDGFVMAGTALLALYLVAASSWARMNPAHLLWICDVALLLAAIGLLRRNALLLAAQLTALCAIHLMWNLDFWSCFFFDYFPLGSTAYMYQYHHTLGEKCISFVTHVFVVPIVFAAVVVLGVPKRAWRLQAVETLIIAFLTCLLTSPSQKINWIFGSLFTDVTPFIYVVHYAGMVFLFPIVLYWPTNVLLRRFTVRCRAWLGLPPVAADATIEMHNAARPAIRFMTRHSALATLAVVSIIASVTVVVPRAADQRFALDPTTCRVDNQFQASLTALPVASRQAEVEDIVFGSDRTRTVPLVTWPEQPLPLRRRQGTEGPRETVDTSAVLEQVSLRDIPNVSQYVVIRGRRQVPGSVVWLHIADDACRFARYCDIYTYRDRFEVWCKLDENADEAEAVPAEDSQAATIHGLSVIEIVDRQCVARSPFYLVKRPGVAAVQSAGRTDRTHKDFTTSAKP